MKVIYENQLDNADDFSIIDKTVGILYDLLVPDVKSTLFFNFDNKMNQNGLFVAFTTGNFEIKLKPTDNINEMLRTLCHEFWHFHTVVYNRMKRLLNGYVFDSIFYSDNNSNEPWEVEARQKENELLAFVYGSLTYNELKYLEKRLMGYLTP